MEPRKGDRRAPPVIGLAGARSGAAGPLRRFAPLRILQTAVSQPQRSPARRNSRCVALQSWWGLLGVVIASGGV